ncbi:hypothetical protein PGSY75_1444900 [Plasmodium gaboni]|uniref:Uncharacterized protein n=1 Tax=Plasmodium gaboni TaxID=647221 RepID=A0A151LAQ7_9APIC|nr:hypothetical protein PGSY75_1444900 [Plasmodium gaboni]KYN96042.1 hypothetical protein PGSY75_1444900 [Plasmodium gaboni]SOV19311.1 conserved Plasmodium protein, unknown function [Plasmodium gaboni]
MIKLINGIFLRSKYYYKNYGKVNYSSLQLFQKNVNKYTDIIKMFTVNKNEENMKCSFDNKNIYYMPLCNSFIYNKEKDASLYIKKIKNRNNDNNKNDNNSYDDHKSIQNYCNDKNVNMKNEKVLLFSWLKTVRKKQYYNIIGKIGIKKKNAGMYWSFYVNKRKKIRKKRRTI